MKINDRKVRNVLGIVEKRIQAHNKALSEYGVYNEIYAETIRNQYTYIITVINTLLMLGVINKAEHQRYLNMLN